MKTVMKAVAMSVLAAALFWLHRRQRRRNGDRAGGYGLRLLGLEQSAGRQAYVDKLRCLAAVLVILVHGFQSAAGEIPDAMAAAEGFRGFFLGIAGLALSCNVLFVFLSGALLLPYREERIGLFYGKRAAGVLIPLAAYYAFYLRQSGRLPFTAEAVLAAARQILSGPMELVPHFWLVYVLLGLYLGVPFLRYLLKALPEAGEKALLAVIAAGLTGEFVLRAVGISPGFSSFLFEWEGIFLLGYLFTRPWCRAHAKQIQAAGLVSGALVFFCYLTGRNSSAAVSVTSPLMLLFTAALFSFFQEKGKRRQGGAAVARLVRMVSKYSYSILLIHWFFLFVIVKEKWGIGMGAATGVGALGGVLLQAAVVFVLSFVFAVLYDQTVVFVLKEAWEGLLVLTGRRGREKRR